jgi:hypothetical protein
VEVEFVKRHGLMEETADQRLQMTTLGKQCFSGVVSLFYSPSVKEHVMQLGGGEQFVEDPITALQAGRVPFVARSQVNTRPVRRRRRPATSTATATATAAASESATAPLSQAAVDAGVLSSTVPGSTWTTSTSVPLSSTPSDLLLGSTTSASASASIQP